MSRLQEAEVLLIAMGPMENVIAAFADSAANRYIESSSRVDGADEVDRDCNGIGKFYLQLEEQDRFAEMVDANWNSMGPSKRYLRRLIRSYVHQIEEQDGAVESDALSELVLRATFNSDPIVPSPEESCYQSFWVPHQALVSTTSNSNPVSLANCDKAERIPLALRIRIFPYHNSVALRLWEAGAALAEYLLVNSELVSGCNVVELGAGVGCTGLVVAGCCDAKSVHMTDYEEMCLENLEHNIRINGNWLSRRRQGKAPDVTQGYLDWGSVAEEGPSSCLIDADVLIAADVIYDPTANESLALTILHFLRSGEPRSMSPGTTRGSNEAKKRQAIFGITRRNMATFEKFLEQLKQHGITCEWLASEKDWKEIPLLFPCQFVQPRSHIRIASLTITSET